ncbi:MAG: phosphoribosylformimino-5-aminoimidazole carboxamide ribotide isomerase [Clostridia bacterium]|nr:phosphoribosylformimino-5-aminoimidazole carboxamide ribotide isomerase [Clostridia bacterium]NCC42589.1 phosphoribosylformimino-5-aminoimidazole carboxamide ribotide isomerase [Clostridia bacterium]
MRFRPCIDIHNGKVKQIVGGSLKDWQDQAEENFVSGQDAAFYARMYQSFGIKGGHIILLNPSSSPYYMETKQQAINALKAYPGGLQVGGGIHDQNAAEFLEAGASHVIVTSFVFKDGRVSWENLERMQKEVGKKKLVLDLSCRKKDGQYYIVTDRWQKFTQVPVTKDTLDGLSAYCDEFLVHAVDVEGKASGIETQLVKLLADCKDIPVTYAGGVGSFENLAELREAGENRVDVTVGSALDLFGGHMAFEEVIKYCENQ